MIKTNLPADKYYTQRNNAIKPTVACMPTAYTMFLIGNKIPFENPTEMANDDYFMSLLNTEKANNYCHIKYPWSTGYPPNQIHGMYGSYLSPIVCRGKRASDFQVNLTWGGYIARILAGQVIMTSGEFGEISGHAFCIIGYNDAKECLILADPWGDFRDGYKTHYGYGVEMNYGQFVAHVKPAGELLKWGHVKI